MPSKSLVLYFYVHFIPLKMTPETLPPSMTLEESKSGSGVHC